MSGPWLAGDSGARARAVVAGFAERRLGGLGHERRVAAHAEHLLRLTGPRHDLTPADARTLGIAALLHDIGRAGGKAGHAARGAREVLHDTALPLRPARRRVVAYLVAHHSGPVPEPGLDAFLRPGDGRAAARLMLALLRCADGLDRRRGGSAGRVTLDGLTLGVELPAGVGLRPGKVRKRARLLCGMLGLHCDVSVAPAPTPARVAA